MKKVVTLTNLFPFPDDPTRGVFNLQQFSCLPKNLKHEVIVPVPWRQWKRKFAAARFCEGIATRYFPFFYPPVIARASHGVWMWHSLRASLLPHIRESSPDCVLGCFLFPDGYAASRLSRVLKIPLVLKAHGSDLNLKAFDPVTGPAVRSILPNAAALIVVSQALALQASRAGVEAERIRVIPNGVDIELFRPAGLAESRASLGWSPQARSVLYCGNLKVGKGCVDLLQAVPYVIGEISDVQFTFVGDGEARKLMEKTVQELGIHSHVRLLGRRPHGELASFMNAADVLVLPSHAEGIPNVLLEAMACGCPVVATRVGGIPEIVPADSGELVEPRNPRKLAEAICNVINRPRDRARIRIAVENKSWVASGAAVGAVLEEAMSL